VTGKGALGTWRSPCGQRRQSEEPRVKDESRGQPKWVGVYASERLSLTCLGQASRGKAKAKTGLGKSDLPGLQGGPRKRDSVSYDPVRAPRLYPDPEEPIFQQLTDTIRRPQMWCAVVLPFELQENRRNSRSELTRKSGQKPEGRQVDPHSDADGRLAVASSGRPWVRSIPTRRCKLLRWVTRGGVSFRFVGGF
jgi:hypothetical protein